MQMPPPKRSALNPLSPIFFVNGAVLVLVARGRGWLLVAGLSALAIGLALAVSWWRAGDESRQLPPAVIKMLSDVPEIRPNSQCVDFHLRDGSLVEKQYVACGEQLIMSMWRSKPSFDFDDIVAVTPHDAKPR